MTRPTRLAPGVRVVVRSGPHTDLIGTVDRVYRANADYERRAVVIFRREDGPHRIMVAAANLTIVGYDR